MRNQNNARNTQFNDLLAGINNVSMRFAFPKKASSGHEISLADPGGVPGGPGPPPPTPRFGGPTYTFWRPKCTIYEQINEF